MTDDERDCLERLEEWESRLDTLLKMYDERGFIPVGHRKQARELYRSLKADLKAEAMRMGTIAGRAAALSAAERRWYQSVVQAASTTLRTPTKAQPESWYSDLNEARVEIRRQISGMKDALGVE